MSFQINRGDIAGDVISGELILIGFLSVSTRVLCLIASVMNNRKLPSSLDARRHSIDILSSHFDGSFISVFKTKRRRQAHGEEEGRG